MQTGRRIGILVGIAAILAFGIGEAPAATGLCPPSSAVTICADFSEPSGVTNLKDTVVTFSLDGAAVAPITLNASAATGGGTQSVALTTVACERHTYTASAYSEYTTALGVMKSLSVSATPGGGMVRDRTGEASCFKAPTGFTLH